jgi:homoserine kinase
MRLRAPATTANMGSGFDVMGMALKLHNTVQFEKANRLKVLSIGRYGREIEEAQQIFGNAIERFEKATGKMVPGVQIIQECNIPPARGLGSSAAAIASALFIANIMTGGSIPVRTLLQIGTEIEGHPDNIVPCMLGGLVVSYYDSERLDYEKFEMTNERLTFLVPEFKLSTDEMRKALPESVPFRDAVSNLKNVSQFISKIAKGNLTEAFRYTQDSIHQIHRINSDPRMKELISYIEERHPNFWFVSGSGSSVCCDLEDVEGLPYLEAVIRTSPANEPFIVGL